MTFYSSQFVEIRNVTKLFGSYKALKDVSLSIESGEFLTFLGPSGCGKTTLLRIFAGFLKADAGSLSLAGKQIDHLPPYRRPVGMVFQNLALFPHMTASENVSFGLTLSSYDRQAVARKVGDILAVVGLEGFADRRVTAMSGGQRQRVALARALVLEPQVLLLDEPLSALDLKLRRQLQIELKQIQRRTGTTFVFVTHDQEEAMAMSDRIAVFNAGRIEQVGMPDEIYERPQSRFVAEFVGETNFLRVIRSNRKLSIQELGIDVQAPEPDQQADKSLISARPEHFTLVPPASSQGVCVGRIVEREYLGSIVRLTARVMATGHVLRVMSSPTEAARWDNDQDVGLCLDVERAAFVPEKGIAP